jgi:rhodanese-related sulfurtransferase
MIKKLIPSTIITYNIVGGFLMLKNISVKNIDPNNMKIIDIRNREKYNTSHIPGSINIEILDLNNNPEKYLNFNEIYYIYCQYGKTSIKTCINLSKKGYNVINIMGGYESWLINESN